MKTFITILVFAFMFISCVSECNEQAYTITIYNNRGEINEIFYCARVRVPYFSERYPSGTILVLNCAGDIIYTIGPNTQYFIKPTE